MTQLINISLLTSDLWFKFGQSLLFHMLPALLNSLTPLMNDQSIPGALTSHTPKRQEGVQPGTVLTVAVPSMPGLDEVKIF